MHDRTFLTDTVGIQLIFGVEESQTICVEHLARMPAVDVWNLKSWEEHASG